MNNYQNTTSGAGLLKDFYQSAEEGLDPLSEALKRRRMKLMETRLGATGIPDDSDIEQNAIDNQRALAPRRL